MTFFFTYLFMVMVFWRPQEWLITWMYGWPVLDVVVIMSLLVLFVDVNENRVVLPRRIPQVYMLFGLWVASLLSHVAHTYFAGVVYTFPEVFKICFFTALLFVVLDRPSRLRIIAYMMVFMACTMAVHAILQEKRGYGFANQRPFWVPALLDEPEHSRSTFFGIFHDPNDLAQFLASTIPLAFVLDRRRTPLGFLAGCGVTWLLVRALLTTHSRGGMIGLAAVIIVTIVLWFPSRTFPYLMLIGLMGALGLCPYAGFVLDESAHERVVFWGMANEVFKRNPVFGIGYEMFWQVARDRAAHNAFVECYTELGVVGYWFWFGMALLGVVGAWRVRRALTGAYDPEVVWLRRFAGAGIVSMTAFCGSGYFLSRTFVYPMFFFFALLGVLPTIAEQYLPADHPPLIEVKRDVWRMVTVGTFASIVYVYISIILLNKAFYG